MRVGSPSNILIFTNIVMENTCVVGDAVENIKQLQERVQILEKEQQRRQQQQQQEPAKQEMGSVEVVERSQVVEDENEDELSDHEELKLLEIEARVYKKNILLKIECEKRKGLLVKILLELEKLNLGVVNISVAPFGNLLVDITIIAEMEKEFSVPEKDTVRALRSALQAAP